jgi:cytochrome c oxidase subunit 4
MRMEQHVSVRTYWIVFAVLMALLVLTVGITRVNLGPFNVVAGLTIAVIKAVLIILYFMHVRYSQRLIWLFAAAAFFWVGIMIGFTITDYITRPILPSPGR